MALTSVVLELALVVGAMLVTATLVIVGLRRLATAVRDFRWRVETCALPLGALGSVLFARWATQDALPRLSSVIGYRITTHIHQLEVAMFSEPLALYLQAQQTPALTSFFVFIYLYGYAFLLLFPFVAYFALEDMTELSTLILAYAANYSIGLVCYVVFIAYGPRNHLPHLVDPILYDTFPLSGYLTFEVNQATNVFPSLHTSMALTVLFLAWLTREKYPLWVPVSGLLALSVVTSTMYLGIHWFVDVVAGTLLAVVSVYVGVNYTVEEILRSTRLFLGARFEQGRNLGRE